MREIVLDPSFVQKVQELNAKRDIPSIVLYLAKALDELPADMVDYELEMAMILRTISQYLRENDANKIDAEIRAMEKFKEEVEELVRNEKQTSGTNSMSIHAMFSDELLEVCFYYCLPEEYISAIALDRSSLGEFEIAFADLFIMMANEPLVYA